MSCRSRLATLNEKLTALERRIEYIEARVSAGPAWHDLALWASQADDTPPPICTTNV